MNSGNELEREYLELIDRELNEQNYQEFLERNSKLIPAEFLLNHGRHFDLVFRKLRIADDYVTDFAYLTKSSVQWRCVLVEIEKPSSKFFKASSTELHKNFTDALQQISQWRAWFNTGNNKQNFLDRTLGPVRTPLSENSCEIKYVLVHGRRKEFQNNRQRTSLIHAEEREDFRILSFDNLGAGVDSKRNSYIAKRTNECVEIISNEFVSENIFSWVAPSLLKINANLRRDIEQNRDDWNSIDPSPTQGNGLPSHGHGLRMRLDVALPQIGTTTDSV